MDRPSATTIQINDVEAGDYFFLCSDGVLHCVDDDELLSILSSDKTDREKMDIIAEKSRNSSDNNTAYLIGVEDVVREDSEVSVGSDIIDVEAPASVTTPLEKPHGVACETYADVEPKGSKISSFFKRLFG